jgi:hypothetical protein
MNLSLSKKTLSYVFAGAVLALASCKKDRLPAVEPQPTGTKGVYVLCEGAFTQIPGINNSTITYYDLSASSVEKDFFKKQNGISLGTNATDLKQYGSKMYCVITGTAPANKDSYVEVINVATGKSLKRIPFSDADRSFQPRYVTFYKDKAYVSGYDGYITRIDTASMSIESRIKVGGAMEQMAVVNGKLYVTNSAHYQYATDNKASVSVVDLNTFTKVKDIATSVNPIKISATSAGDLFVATASIWGTSITAAFDKLSGVTDTKISSSASEVQMVYTYGSTGFVIAGSYPYQVSNFNTSTGVIGNAFVTDGTAIALPYDVTVNPLSGDVYVTDATDYTGDGKTFCFGADGKKKFQFATGTVPRSPVFNYSYN